MAIQRMTGARNMQKCKIVTKEGMPIDMSKMATVGSLTVMKRSDQKKEKLKSHVCFHVSIMILVALLSTTVMVVAAATILNEEYGNLFGNGTMIFGRNSTIYTEQPTPTSSRRIVIFLNTSETDGQFVITSITSDDISAESLANYFGVDKDNQKCKLIVDQIALLAFSALVILGLILPGLKKISIAYLLIWFYSVSLLAYVCVIYTNTAYETKKSQIFFRGFVLVFAMFSLMTFVMQDAKGSDHYFEPQKVYVVVDKNMKVRKVSKRTSNPAEAKTDTIGSQTETTIQPQNDLNVKLPENLV